MEAMILLQQKGSEKRSGDHKATHTISTGELIFELKKQTDNNTSEFPAAVAEVLKEKASVAAKTHMVTLQCKDLDEVTTKGEMCNALHVQCGISIPNELAIHSMKATYNGTQTIFISLLAGGIMSPTGNLVAKALFPLLGIRPLGHTVYRNILNQAVQKKREDGYMTASCANKTKCALCERNHAAGSARCPRFLGAVRRRV